MDAHCAVTVAVIAEDGLRLRRLMKRDRRSEEEIRARMNAGKPAAWYKSKADYILDGGSDTLERDALTLLGVMRDAGADHR
jgi:dephospho-CoA kinase